MSAWSAVGRLAVGVLVGGGMVMGVGVAEGQMAPQTASAAVRACGAMGVNYSVSAGMVGVATSGPGDGTAAAQGKALVYVFEDVDGIPFNAVNFRVGVDGAWVGATKVETYLSFVVTPGVHHLCVDHQGMATEELEKGITLRQLKAEAGKTYYLRVRYVEGRTLPLVLVETVDEDEGQFLLQTMRQAVWHAK